MGRWKRNRLLALLAAVAVMVIIAGGCSGKPKKKSLGEIPIDIEAMAKKGTRHYSLGLNADPKTWDWKSKNNILYTETTDVLPGTVELFDTLTAGAKTFNMRITCKKSPFLDVISSRVTEEQNGKILDESRVEVANGKLRQTFAKTKGSDIDYPDNVVSQAALMRIVEQLPREKGVFYTFPGYFDPQEPRPETGDGIGLECTGETDIKVADRQEKCFMFVLKGVRRESRFYVDGTGLLQFVEMDGGYTRMALLTPGELAKFPFKSGQGAPQAPEAAGMESAAGAPAGTTPATAAPGTAGTN